MQEALTIRVTTTVFQYVDVQDLADQTIAALAAQGLRPELVARLKTFTPALATAVTGFVRDKGRPDHRGPPGRGGLEPGPPGCAPAVDHGAVG